MGYRTPQSYKPLRWDFQAVSVTWWAVALWSRFSRYSYFCQVLVGFLGVREAAAWGHLASEFSTGSAPDRGRKLEFTALPEAAQPAVPSLLGLGLRGLSHLTLPTSAKPSPTPRGSLPPPPQVTPVLLPPRHARWRSAGTAGSYPWETRRRVGVRRDRSPAIPHPARQQPGPLLPRPRRPLGTRDHFPRFPLRLPSEQLAPAAPLMASALLAPSVPPCPPYAHRTAGATPIPHTWARSRSTFSCIIAFSCSKEKPGSGGSGAAAEKPPRAPSMAATLAWRSLVRTPR